MKKLLFLTTIFLAMLGSVAFISCTKDDDDNNENTEKPDTQTDPAVKEGYCPDANHPHLINLGKGMLWCCCNVDAKQPSDFGGFYAWGELEEKDNYDITTYIYSDRKDEQSCWELDQMFESRYIPFTDHTYSISATPFDVAYVKMGKQWMMPNDTDAELLIDNCKFQVTKLNGVDGCKMTGPSGKSIFLPAGGVKVRKGHYTELSWGLKGEEGISSWGLYLVGTRYADWAKWDCEGFAIDTREGIYIESWDRVAGRMVRPIKNSIN